MAELKFKGWLAEHNIKQGEIAKLLEQSLTATNMKINGKYDFKVSEVRLLCKTYGVDANIFL